MFCFIDTGFEAQASFLPEIVQDALCQSQEKNPSLNHSLGFPLQRDASSLLKCMPVPVPKQHLAGGTDPGNALTFDYKADMQNSPGDKHCPLLSSPSQKQV